MIFKYLKKLDWILIISVLILVILGLISIYSSSSTKRGEFFNFKKQIIFLGIGFLGMILISFFDWRIFKTNPYLILVLYGLCILGLGGLFFGAPQIRGVRSWYRINLGNGISWSLGPVEFVKIVLVVLLAKFFSMRHTEMYRIRHIVLSGIYVGIPAVLIFFQPDLGSVLILLFLWATILVVSGIKLRHFFVLFLCFLLILALGWMFLLKDYQKQRVLSFLEPQLEPQGAGWSQKQAKIAIGSGGLSGQGIGEGPQTQHGFLPEPQTDFIFSAIAEETGLVGISFLFFIFCVVIWRIIKIALISEKNFPRLLATGLATILVAQVFIHVGMNLGLLPIIGISLPFVSYGGSNLISLFLGIGILQSIRIY